MPDDVAHQTIGKPAAPARDHMGRREAESVMDAFRMDWPWIIALCVLMAYVVASLGGNFRM
jgi:hypothetical protein